MEPISAIANAVGALANAAGFIGMGRRQQRDQWGPNLDPTNFQYNNNTGTIIIAAGTLILIIIIVAIARKK